MHSNELHKLRNLYTTAIDIIEAEFSESSQFLKDRIASIEKSVPCRLVVGDSLAVRYYAPEEPDEVDWEADVIHQYRPGAEYATNLSTGGQASFRDIQTPELTDTAIVIAGGLSISSFARKAALIPMIQWADHLIFANANSRLSEGELDALKLILTLRQYAPGASEESALPVIYVQHVLNSAAEEAQELFEANLASLTAAGLTIDDSFLIRGDENDPESLRLNQSLESNEATIRQSQYRIGCQQLKETITPVKEACAEKAKFYTHQREEGLNYEQLLNRRVKLNKLIKEGKYTKDPMRALQNSQSQGRYDLASSFRTIPENGGPSLYADAKQVIDSIIDSTPSAVTVKAKHDRARLRSNDILIQGFSTSINRAIKDQNETLLTLRATTAEEIKKDLADLGFIGLFMPPTKAVEIPELDPVEIPELDPKTLPTKGDKAFRYGIGSFFGGGAGAVLMEAGLDLGAVVVPIIGVSVPIAVLAGIAVGCVLVFLTLRSQTEKSYAAEMEAKLRETLGVLATQASHCYDQFSIIWQRILEDDISNTLRRAEEAVDAELAAAKMVSTKSPEEVKEIAEQYAAMVRELEDILKKLETN